MWQDEDEIRLKTPLSARMKDEISVGGAFSGSHQKRPLRQHINPEMIR